MKSPADIGARLAKQWHQSVHRIERLLSRETWPLELSIGKPTGIAFATRTSAVQEHVQRWKAVNVGEVIWESIKYRAGADAIAIPVYWRIRTPSEWIVASADVVVQREFAALEYLVARTPQTYHELLVRDRPLWRNKNFDEVLTTVGLADILAPGAAKGRPLRLLADLGVDTKFFERNGTLLTRLLDERFQGAASEQGLHAFLDAYDESDHWVLVVPLDQNLLPFRRQRVTTQELTQTKLPCSRVLVIENEHCIHQLPRLVDTVAILGAGLDLQWLHSPFFDEKSLAYWGDMDTWGLLMLARARQHRPDITPLLMTQLLFDKYADQRAVPEPTVANNEAPLGLTESETNFYFHLLNQKKGRLEQEYLPECDVQEVLFAWVNSA